MYSKVFSSVRSALRTGIIIEMKGVGATDNLLVLDVTANELSHYKIVLPLLSSTKIFTTECIEFTEKN
jgi:hypothetical protein